jgi:hypothetical protein
MPPNYRTVATITTVEEEDEEEEEHQCSSDNDDPSMTNGCSMEYNEQLFDFDGLCIMYSNQQSSTSNVDPIQLPSVP